MEHIKYAKNVLDPDRLRDLKDLCINHFHEIPAYNFCRKEQESSNLLEEIIRHLIGRDHHVEYWVRNGECPTLFHVDGNELQQKFDFVKYGGFDPDQKIEFPLNNHVLFVNIEPGMEGGVLCLSPYSTYEKGRPVCDNSYEPLENSSIIEIVPKENNLVLWNKPIYHAVSEVTKTDGRKRITFMFSSWGHVPEIYKDHKHWTNFRTTFHHDNDSSADRSHCLPQPMEFDLK